MVWTASAELDDMRFGRVMERVGFDVGAAASSAIIGFAWGDPNQRGLMTGNYSELVLVDPCPNVTKIDNNGCTRFVAPVRQILFFHTGSAEFQEPLQMARNIWNAPLWLYYYRFSGFSLAFCRYTGPKRFTALFPLP
jgi:hypothetical protein